MRFAMTPALPVLLLAACTGGADRLPVQGDVLVEGPVLRMDMEPMVRDGDGRIWIQDPDYGTVVVLVPARRHQLCSADDTGDAHQAAPGSVLRARGAVTARGEVRVCAQQTHFLRMPSQGGP